MPAVMELSNAEESKFTRSQHPFPGFNGDDVGCRDQDDASRLDNFPCVSDEGRGILHVLQNLDRDYGIVATFREFPVLKIEVSPNDLNGTFNPLWRIQIDAVYLQIRVEHSFGKRPGPGSQFDDMRSLLYVSH